MRSEWKILNISTNEIFRIKELNMTCRVILFLIADSSDDFHPSYVDLGKKTNMDKRNVSRYTKTLIEKKFIKQNGLTERGWIKWQIVIETVIEALQLSHLTSHQSDDRQITSHQSDDGTDINLMTPRHQSDDTNLQRNLQRNLQKNNPPRKELPVKKAPRPHSLKLAKLWYDKTPPTEKHNKEAEIIKWARYLDTEQNVTGYSDQQMTEMVMFRNENHFWCLKGAPRPTGLSTKGKDGVRKTIKIYEQSCIDHRKSPKQAPVRLLRPDELPF